MDGFKVSQVSFRAGAGVYALEASSAGLEVSVPHRASLRIPQQTVEEALRERNGVEDLLDEIEAFAGEFDDRDFVLAWLVKWARMRSQ